MSKAKDILLKARRVAVVRTDKLGDMVLTLPLSRALKEYLPNCEISVIAHSYTEVLLNNSNVVDKAFYIDKSPDGINGILKNNHFDAVFFPRPRLEEAFSAFRHRVPLRIGTSYRYYSFLFNHRVADHRSDARYHEAEYNVRLLGSVTGEEHQISLVPPFINPEWRKTLNQTLSDNSIFDGDQLVIVHPSSGGSARDWSAENFGLLASQLTEKYQVKVIITGTVQEAESCQIVQNQCYSAVNLCSKLNLGEMMALLERCQLIVANSTGVLHIAAALGRNCIGLYPNTPAISSKRWGPYSSKAATIGPPEMLDGKYCDDMSLITVDSVANGVERFLY